jgi:hypothetical protein
MRRRQGEHQRRHGDFRSEHRHERVIVVVGILDEWISVLDGILRGDDNGGTRVVLRGVR